MDIHEFLIEYFNTPGPKAVIQIGANDGIACDPLRPHLAEPGNYRAILVEPLPYYASKLKALYAGRQDVQVVQAACATESGSRTMYYIEPGVAGRMNGTGPANNWAHCQGSFEKDMVIHWIHANEFRGAVYVSEVPEYIAAITSIELLAITIQELELPVDFTANVLLVLDVQGAELEVLHGVDWTKSPRYILFEDDCGKGRAIAEYLVAQGYRYLLGGDNKVYTRGPHANIHS